MQEKLENIIICISFHHFYFWEELFCRSFSVSDNYSHFGICSWRSHRSLFGKCHLVFIAYFKKFSIHNGEIPFRVESKNILDEDPCYSTKILIFSFTWAGGLAVFPQIKHNIMKVVQSQTILLQKYNNWVYPKKCGPFYWLGVDLNLFKVLGHTWDPMGSPPGY